VTLDVDFKVDELCAQLTRDLFAIAKFLLNNIQAYISFIVGVKPVNAITENTAEIR